MAGGLALLVYGMSQAPADGWTSGATIVRLALAVLLLIAFVIVESRVRNPLAPLGIFHHRTLTGANIVGFLLGAPSSATSSC